MIISSSIAQVFVKVGAVHCRMAASGKAWARIQARIVSYPFPDGRKILLGMAAKTKIIIAHNKHLLMNGSVHLMANHTAFTQGFMFPDKWPALLLVAFETSLIDAFHRSSRPRPDFLAVSAMTA